MHRRTPFRRKTTERSSSPLIQNVLSKPDAVVGEHDLARILRSVKVDIGRNAEIAIAIRIVEDLAYVPNVVRALVGLVDDKIRTRTRIGVQENLFMRLIKRIERFLPLSYAEAPLHIHIRQLFYLVRSGKAHTAEQRVAHEHREAAAVAHHGIRFGRRRSIFHRACSLPFVDQAGVDRANHQAKP